MVLIHPKANPGFETLAGAIEFVAVREAIEFGATPDSMIVILRPPKRPWGLVRP